MTELLLNTIYSLRNGIFELLVECIRLIIPYAFAYDHINYARYLTSMLGDLLKLPTEFPDIYEEFLHGNFVTQLTEGTKFARVETDKVTEMTLNNIFPSSSQLLEKEISTSGFQTSTNKERPTSCSRNSSHYFYDIH